MVATAAPAYDLLIVGAGLAGTSLAWLATRAGLRVLVVERRDHVGGLAASERRDGIDVQRYGPHILHASDPEVIALIRATGTFRPYRHCPLALSGGRLFSLPFNLHTLNQLWGITTPAEAEARLAAARIPDRSGRDSLADRALALVGEEVYETLIRVYSEKQWGRPCEELPGSLLERLAFRMVYDSHYFSDPFEVQPLDGYDAWFRAMLDGAELRLGCDVLADRAYYESLAPLRVYTGPLDRFFEHRDGSLGWRALRFETTRHEGTRNVQGVSVLNLCDASHAATRRTEHIHFDREAATARQEALGLCCSYVTHEYSYEATSRDDAILAYPEFDEANRRLAAHYMRLAEAEPGWHFTGRLARYRYQNMDQVLRDSLDLARRLLPAAAFDWLGDEEER